MPKGKKFFCACGEYNSVTAKKCKACGAKFKVKRKANKLLKKLAGEKVAEPKTYEQPGRGRTQCSCGIIYGCRLPECPVCFLPKKDIVVKKVDPWPDTWSEDAKAWGEKFGVRGTPIYALGNVVCDRPKLTKEDIAGWAENILYEYSTNRKFVTRQAIQLLLRRFFEGVSLKKAFTYLKEWEKKYDY